MLGRRVGVKVSKLISHDLAPLELKHAQEDFISTLRAVVGDIPEGCWLGRLVW
jgi:hypothetical protein